MTEEEKKIFWKLDDKNYLVDKNKTYKKLFMSFIVYNSNEAVQDFINRIIAWYSVKYPDNHIEMVMSDEFEKIDYSLVDIMSFDKLCYKTLDAIKFVRDKDSLCYKYLVVMAGWGLIYDRNSNPDYGLFRVKEMFCDFNSYYGWNLNTNVYESIVDVDYSLNNPEIVKLLEKKKYSNEKIEKDEKREKKNKLPRIKKLFRR